MYRSNPLAAMRRCALLIAALVSPIAAAAATTDSADRLVDLLRPHERDVRNLAFMLKVNPFTELPAGTPGCDMKQVAPALRTAYVQHYRQQLTARERDAAVAFFAGPQGQDIAARRHRRELTMMQAASSGQQVSESALEDPPALKAALAAFHATPDGSRFVNDAIDKQGPGGDALEAIRSEALMRCLKAADGAAKSKAKLDAAPASPAAQAPVTSAPPADAVRFVLENQGSEEQSGFSVDLYPGTPSCEGPPVRVMQTSASAWSRTQTVDVTPSRVLSFAMRATYPGAGSGEASCSPGAMSFVPMRGTEYRAVFRERGTGCWVELLAFDLDNNRAARRVPVAVKRLQMDASGQHRCDSDH